MTDVVQVVTTTDSRESADALARGLVEARLAACVQVDGPISSTYWWEDKAETDEEWRLTVKTAAARYDELNAWITAHHSYDTPEILACPVSHGHSGYVSWVLDETRRTGQ